MPSVQPLVLLVDDEEDLCLLMQMTLNRMGIQTHVAYNLTDAKKQLQQHSYEACLTDLNLPDGHGLDFVHFVTEHYPQTPIGVLTAYGNMDIAVAALKAGAFDFVSKPVNQLHLHQLIEKALQLSGQTETLPSALEEQLLIGRSPAIQQLRLHLNKIARSQAPVFIQGELGTGKEVVANLVHRLSARNTGAWITFNCDAIPASELEATLFGYKKGSFSGALQDKAGLLMAAKGGTLFIDEVGKLPLHTQAKLLQALQERRIRPLGATQEVDVDVRIITASHEDLAELVQQGLFRQDLFLCIHVMPLLLPPLREREEDIVLLAQHFIDAICKEWNIASRHLCEAAKQYLMQYNFPGNVRELRSMMERAITLSDDTTIELVHVKPNSKTLSNPNTLLSNNLPSNSSALPSNKLPSEGLEAYLEKIEKEVLMLALEQTHWNRTLAAKKLGMSFRSLRYRLKKFGLDCDDAEEE